jgi:hypothetical protein
MTHHPDRPDPQRPEAAHDHGVPRGRAIVARVALLLLAVAALYQGIWAQLAPRSFYGGFPGGMGWVATEGPFNEHLVRDIGGLANGLAVVAIAAAWTLSRPLLIANALGWLVYAVPHAVFHLAHPLAGASTQAQNVVVLTAEIVLPLLGLIAVSRRREAHPIPEGALARTHAGRTA